MDGKQLKNSILQWAIQGKLVPQNPKDESASQLLERIKVAKEQLIKEGRIKKEAPLTSITDEKNPFEIPKNWMWVRLQEIVFLTSGNQYNELDIGIPYVKVADMNLADNQKEIITSSRFTSRDNKGIIPVSSIIFPKRGGAILTNKKRIVQKKPIFVDSNTMAMTMILPDILFYIKYWFDSIDLADLCTGTSIPQINNKDLYPILLPLPPLAEQKRIVAKLEQVLPLVDEYNAAQEQLDKLNKELPEALKKSILQQAIQGKLVPQNPKDEPAQKLLERITAARSEANQPKGAKSKKSSSTSRIYCENGTWYEQIGNTEPKDISDEIPFEIPTSWVWTRMGNIGSWGAGATPAKGNPAFYKNGVIPWLVTGELNNSIVTETKTKVSKIALEKCSLRLCKPGDVLIAMYGATIGKLAIAGIELTTNQACCACSLHYDYNKYLFYFLMASKSDLIKRGEGGAQPNISKEKLVNYLIPLPPLAEQKRIVVKLEQLFKVL